MGEHERQLIRDGYAAFARGDMDWIRNVVHRDFELHTIFAGTGDVYRGTDALTVTREPCPLAVAGRQRSAPLA